MQDREIVPVGPEHAEARCILCLPRVINWPCQEYLVGPGVANGLTLQEGRRGLMPLSLCSVSGAFYVLCQRRG